MSIPVVLDGKGMDGKGMDGKGIDVRQNYCKMGI